MGEAVKLLRLQVLDKRGIADGSNLHNWWLHIWLYLNTWLTWLDIWSPFWFSYHIQWLHPEDRQRTALTSPAIYQLRFRATSKRGTSWRLWTGKSAPHTFYSVQCQQKNTEMPSGLVENVHGYCPNPHCFHGISEQKGVWWDIFLIAEVVWTEFQRLPRKTSLNLGRKWPERVQVRRGEGSSMCIGLYDPIKVDDPLMFLPYRIDMTIKSQVARKVFLLKFFRKRTRWNEQEKPTCFWLKISLQSCKKEHGSIWFRFHPLKNPQCIRCIRTRCWKPWQLGSTWSRCCTSLQSRMAPCPRGTWHAPCACGRHCWHHGAPETFHGNWWWMLWLFMAVFWENDEDYIFGEEHGYVTDISNNSGISISWVAVRKNKMYSLENRRTKRRVFSSGFTRSYMYPPWR